MQLAFVRFIQPVEDRRVLRVRGGADAALGFVQHEIARRFACLQHLIVNTHAAEFAYFMVRVTDCHAIYRHPPLDQ